MLYTCPPEFLTSEAWYVGTGRMAIRNDKYQVGSGNVTKLYRTAATRAGLEFISYTEYDGTEITSLGWVQVAVTNQLGDN
jgi:hypothetical protein